MARKLTEQDEARGKRLTSIRDALELTQEGIVDLLNETALSLGLPARYKYYTVSRMEAGSISFEDAAVWLAIDPDKDVHGWDWFVLGIERKRVTPKIRDELSGPEFETQVGGFPSRQKKRASGEHRRRA
jgi:hypothetical protein